MSSHILTINGGSSSIKFALYRTGTSLQKFLSGKIDRIGLPKSSLKLSRMGSKEQRVELAAPSHAAATAALIELLGKEPGIGRPSAVGHRIVHGGPNFSQPEKVTPELLSELRRLCILDPEHLPSEIAIVEAFTQHYPDVAQIACFDTAFHRTMPRVARIIPIPREFEALGVQRYGFHGLSYAFLMEEIARLDGAAAARARIILAHLGNGASMAAVRDGQSIDTTMALTPVAGLVMSTRSGDLDPGLVGFLHRAKQMSPQDFHEMIHERSGLLGVSQTSPDMRDLLARRESDVRAAEAVALFCYQARKYIGALAAALGGLDMLVFAGGIGEHAPQVRAEICEDLEFLGVEFDVAANERNADIISTASSRVRVRVIPTDEEQVIARATSDFFNSQTPRSSHG